MRVLLFGSSGQVATEIRRRAGKDCAVEALGRTEADLADPEACAARVAATDADVVINAAAYTAVDRAETEEALALTVNATAPGAMARAAAARGLPFLHISTDYVFDGRPGPAWREEDDPAPLSAYGRTKLAGEWAVQAAGGPHAILRVSWVFAGHGSNFPRTMLRVGAGRDRLRVVDDQHGGPTPASAIADALLTIARAFAAGRGESGLFHFSGAPATTWCGFARAIFAAAGWSTPPVVEAIATEDWPTPAPRPRNSVLDCARIAQVYGVEQPAWSEALEIAVHALQEENT